MISGNSSGNIWGTSFPAGAKMEPNLNCLLGGRAKGGGIKGHKRKVKSGSGGEERDGGFQFGPLKPHPSVPHTAGVPLFSLFFPLGTNSLRTWPLFY